MSTMIDILLGAPWIGLRGNVMHAIDVDQALPKRHRQTHTAVCGKYVRYLDVPLGSQNPVPWPPRVSTIPEGFERCCECARRCRPRRSLTEFARKP